MSAPADALALFGARFQRDPAGVYRELRERHGPVAPVRLEGGVPAWCALGYREVHQVTGDPELFSRDPRWWNRWHQVPENWSLRPFVEPRPSTLLVEAAGHRTRGHAVHEALAGVDAVWLTAQLQDCCDVLVDRFAGRGYADLVVEYTHRIPLWAVVRVCGLPEGEVPMLTHDVALSGQEGEEAVRAYERTMARMRWLVAERRTEPVDDLPSRLVAHPAALSDAEIAADLFLVLAVAHLTTSDWMANALRLMLTDPHFAVGLAGGRHDVGHVLDEVLWIDPPVQNFAGRWATRDTELGGKAVRAGDLVVLGLAAANSDPAVRPRGCPQASGNRAHLAFSHGEHGCPDPARELARAIARTGVEILLDHLPDLALAVPEPDLTWRPSLWLRGLTSLPVTFTPH
ncbi:cytochrome P450 [Saccharopolyspora griseoalba]|uniref:Cytochrome P450 n=1 Tax=Saccharopolyspora griseoalba TaxID=1431848 RepID=A0ABW2LRV9_9PSEU